MTHLLPDDTNEPRLVEESCHHQEVGLRPTDVLFGRGGGVNKHFKDSMFRKTVNKWKPIYKALPPYKKRETAQRVIDELRRNGCRFMEKRDPEDESSTWQEVFDILKIEKKVMQSLRDRDYKIKYGITENKKKPKVSSRRTFINRNGLSTSQCNKPAMNHAYYNLMVQQEEHQGISGLTNEAGRQHEGGRAIFRQGEVVVAVENAIRHEEEDLVEYHDLYDHFHPSFRPVRINLEDDRAPSSNTVVQIPLSLLLDNKSAGEGNSEDSAAINIIPRDESELRTLREIRNGLEMLKQQSNRVLTSRQKHFERGISLLLEEEFSLYPENKRPVAGFGMVDQRLLSDMMPLIDFEESVVQP